MYSGFSKCPVIMVSVIPTSGMDILERIIGAAMRHISLFKI
jgi:hypothetical protein